MKPTIFIDGSAGTTGLQIAQRLSERQDITLIKVDEARRKDNAYRKELLNSCDLAVLCLPDEAAREAVALVENPSVKILDASTAHRTDDEWVYGFPELNAFQADRIRLSRRVANPGCHATGFLALVAPLVAGGLLHAGMSLSCFSLTGYTGGGKGMIADYEQSPRAAMLDAPRPYAMDLNHKHLPEMTKHAGLLLQPCFVPIVADFPQGMETCVPLYGVFPEMALACLSAHYDQSRCVHVMLPTAEPFSANKLAGSDELEIYVTGSGERCLLTAVFDNLGKGAAGAAVQNMELMLGLD